MQFCSIGWRRCGILGQKMIIACWPHSDCQSRALVLLWFLINIWARSKMFSRRSECSCGIAYGQDSSWPHAHMWSSMIAWCRKNMKGCASPIRKRLWLLFVSSGLLVFSSPSSRAYNNTWSSNWEIYNHHLILGESHTWCGGLFYGCVVNVATCG